MAKLRWLDISDTRVTDAGLIHLAGLKSLRTLHVRRTIRPTEPDKEPARVTDAGLNALAGMESFAEIDLSGTGVTLAGVRAFAASRPSAG